MEGHFKMIINTEWASFGDNGAMDFVLNKYDELLLSSTAKKDHK